MSEFSIWFKGKFLEWQAEQMGVKSISDFATFLGVSQPNASRWLNGQSKPRDHENIRRLVGFYGNEVYEVLGIENPITDDRLRLINEHWDGLPEGTKDALADQAGRVKERGDKQKAKTKKG